MLPWIPTRRAQQFWLKFGVDRSSNHCIVGTSSQSTAKEKQLRNWATQKLSHSFAPQENLFRQFHLWPRVPRIDSVSARKKLQLLVARTVASQFTSRRRNQFCVRLVWARVPSNVEFTSHSALKLRATW